MKIEALFEIDKSKILYMSEILDNLDLSIPNISEAIEKTFRYKQEEFIQEVLNEIPSLKIEDILPKYMQEGKEKFFLRVIGKLKIEKPIPNNMKKEYKEKIEKTLEYKNLKSLGIPKDIQPFKSLEEIKNKLNAKYKIKVIN